MEKDIDKAKLGKKIYNICLIITTVILILVLLLVNTEDEALDTRIRSATCFYCFSALLGGGSLIREFLSGEYIKKKMLIKCIALAVIVVLGTAIMILIPKDIVYTAVFFLGLGGYMFTAGPTIVKEEKK